MKCKLLFSSAIFCLSFNTYGGCVGPVVNGECLSGTEVYGYNYGDSDEPQYESSTGSTYQYDLNDPRDSNRYSTDLDAQRRDQMNTDPRRDTDRRTGQYGGGIYDDRD